MVEYKCRRCGYKVNHKHNFIKHLNRKKSCRVIFDNLDIKTLKKELEEKYLRIQNKLELELEKNRILEMEGTIDKLKVQVNELSETIGGEIMYNNTH